MAFVSLDSPSCGVPCLILLSVVYRDVTRQAKGLYRLKHAGARKSGLTYLSRCNSSWFCHRVLLWSFTKHHHNLIDSKTWPNWKRLCMYYIFDLLKNDVHMLGPTMALCQKGQGECLCLFIDYRGITLCTIYCVAVLVQQPRKPSSYPFNFCQSLPPKSSSC
jgi:hypothetical protein